MAGYDDIVKRLRGRDLDKEAQQKADAEDFENTLGRNANSDQEAGIEPDEITESVMDLATMNPASLVKNTGRIAGNQIGKSLVSKLSDKGPPGDKGNPTIQNNARLGQSIRSKDPKGVFSKNSSEIGEYHPRHQELAQAGKKALQDEESRAQVITYNRVRDPYVTPARKKPVESFITDFESSLNKNK